ncbi:MAG: 23S rRNA (uracil(1939)-C(5))-methyltransferase RlmD [Rhodocyclaceae bacterium]|nr:23S rRNA (uracil(1939)-C(5))-methyltransferase RlmD [Rhodocyclaceae bacterium]
MSRRGRPEPGEAPVVTAQVESLDHDGQGVAHVDGKVVFIDGALPGETVQYRVRRSKPRFDNGDLVALLRASPFRTTPRCAHFGTCGGCATQHLDTAAQLAVKQRVLEDNLRHIGQVRAEQMLPPIHGPDWGYRDRARLSARWVAKKGSVLVGFHEKRSSFIADMHGCEVLPPRIGRLLDPLRDLVGRLSLRERMPQVEVALGDALDALVFRVMDPPTPADEALFRAFAERWGVSVWLQPKGPETAYRFHPAEGPPLDYRLPEFDLRLEFAPTEFTQVNPHINRVLVARAIRLLDPQPGERIADWFCGLGNFSLPIARLGADLLGVEGSAALTRRALANARLNGLAARVRFAEANLFEIDAAGLAAFGHFDKWLVDPPRDGAVALCKAIPAEEGLAPSRIVYVSCNPATLARDAALLVHTKGYALRAAGVANMFPHTAHVESVAWFERA